MGERKPTPVGHCTFYLREPYTGGWRYTLVSSEEHVWLPPMVGDLVYLGADTGTCRVVDRRWSYPQPGSVAWRDGTGPLLDLLVERSASLFVGEATAPEDEEEEET